MSSQSSRFLCQKLRGSCGDVCEGASDVTLLLMQGFLRGFSNSLGRSREEETAPNSSSEMETGGENRSCLSLWQLAASTPVLGRNPLPFGRGAGVLCPGHQGGCAGIPQFMYQYSAPGAALLVMLCTGRFEKSLFESSISMLSSFPVNYSGSD